MIALLGLVGQQTEEVFLLGDDFMPWMVLAFGAAMVVGNLLALVRPPGQNPVTSGPADEPHEDELGGGRAVRPRERPPLTRSLVMIGVGLVAAVWGVASLLG